MRLFKITLAVKAGRIVDTESDVERVLSAKSTSSKRDSPDIPRGVRRQLAKSNAQPAPHVGADQPNTLP